MDFPFRVDDVWQMTMVGKLHGQTTRNVFNYRVTEEPIPAIATDVQLDAMLTSVVADLWTDGLQIFCSDEFNLQYFSLQRVKPIRYIAAFKAVDEFGTGAGKSLPSECALVIKRLTELAGKPNRGRVYIAGIASENEAASAFNINPDGVQMGKVLSFMNDTQTVAGSGTLTPIIWSASSPTVLDRLIVTAEMEVPVRAQRRRQLGVGE